MSVDIHFSGRLGNNLIQYSFGRIVAEHYGYALTIKDDNHVKAFPRVTDIDGFRVNENLTEYNDTVNKTIGLEHILSNNKHRKIVIRGYWQKARFYVNHRHDIRNWCWLPDSDRKNEVLDNDVILHIRREDYLLAKSDLNFSYYDQAISELKPERIWIVGIGIDDVVRNHFDKYKPIYANTSEIDDFRLMQCFKNVIMSNSTFCWMSSFISHRAEIVYYPQPVSGYWSADQEQNLFIPGFHRLIKGVKVGNP